MKRQISLLLAAALFSFGCVAFRITTDLNMPRRVVAQDSSIPEFFNLPRTPALLRFEDTETREQFKSQKFSFDSWDASSGKHYQTVRGILYIPYHPQTSDLFIVLPGVGEDQTTALIAEKLAGYGFVTVRIYAGFRPLSREIRKGLLDSPDIDSLVDKAAVYFNGSLRQHIVDLMRLNDYLEAEFKPRAIHVVGISLGGFVASLFDAIDPRVKSLMMILSSANAARIVMESGMIPIGIFRIRIFEKYNPDPAKLYELIREKTAPAEPLTYASRINPQKTLIVSGLIDMLGLIDAAFPYSATRETWEAFGKPKWIIMLPGHISSFLSFLPFWIEFPDVHHWPQTFLLDGSYADHLLKKHFLPMALR